MAELARRASQPAQPEQLGPVLPRRTITTYWAGQAGGELFNGAGTTDILIRHEDLCVRRGVKAGTVVAQCE